jgi:hypothetical protein
MDFTGLTTDEINAIRGAVCTCGHPAEFHLEVAGALTGECLTHQTVGDKHCDCATFIDRAAGATKKRK